jgi:hypothetical protein
MAVWTLCSASAKADYICAPSAIGGESDFGASGSASGDAPVPDCNNKNDFLYNLISLLSPSSERVPSTQAGAGGAGATSYSGSGGSTPPAGYSTRLQLPTLELAGKSVGAYVAYRAPPFAFDIFHPPRAA